jgi:uncharacterized protein (DUF1684 family)
MKIHRVIFSVLVLSVCAGIAMAARAAGEDGAAYRASVEKWRAEYEADLKSDTGWLTVAGLFWLHEGENKFGTDPTNDIVLPEGSAPAEAGTIELHAGKIVAHLNPGVSATISGKQVETAELPPDSRTERLRIGRLTLWVHQSGDRFALRMRDPQSALRRDFHGLTWFPIDESYRMTAKFVTYDKPKEVAIQNLAGDSLQLPISGYAEFSFKGQEFRLEGSFTPEDHPDGVSFVIRDLTSGKETYGAARFLDTDMPKDGTIVLDFNEAYNPPCAYNPYTTCPLPPPGNRMRVRIEAGEKAYRVHP